MVEFSFLTAARFRLAVSPRLLTKQMQWNIHLSIFSSGQFYISRCLLFLHYSIAVYN